MIVLESDILIALERSDPDIIAWVRELRETDDLATTSINVAEVLRGVPPRSRRRARALLEGLIEVPFGPRAAARFGSLMQGLDQVGQPIPAIDGLIAAATLESGAALATGNVRDFERVPGLQMITP